MDSPQETERILSLILKAGQVNVTELALEGDQLTLSLQARIDPETLVKFAEKLKDVLPKATEKSSPKEDSGKEDVPQEELSSPSHVSGKETAPSLGTAQDKSLSSSSTGTAEGLQLGAGLGDRGTAMFVRDLMEKQSAARKEEAAAQKDESSELATKIRAPKEEEKSTEGEGNAKDGRYGEPKPDGEWGASLGTDDTILVPKSPPPVRFHAEPSAPKELEKRQGFAKNDSANETAFLEKDGEMPPRPVPSAPKVQPEKGAPHPAGAPIEEGQPSFIRFVCPKCKTQGSQSVDRLGAIVTCRKCGKAMRLTLKR